LLAGRQKNLQKLSSRLVELNFELVCLLKSDWFGKFGGERMKCSFKTKDTKRSNRCWSLVLLNRHSLKLALLGTVVFLCSTQSAFGSGDIRFHFSRDLSSLKFPIVETESSTGEILDAYQAYFKFVIDIGKDVDRANAAKLSRLYETLKRKNPHGAALFLKGLRFEMVEKVELMGRDPRDISSSSPEIRKWIAKYLKEWVREADEHLFRYYSASKNELALAE
jgi:hypothetical protein